MTDPPAGIGFMGKKWDQPGALVERQADTSVAWDRVGGNHHPENNADKVRTNRVEGARFRDFLRPIAVEMLRVLKPGGHGLVWALPRTSHWTAAALEEAGFEIRDRVLHLFGTGFPKSHNLDDGRGTALKPAAEDWWLVRKPLDGTVAQNVLAHGTGALNIDACRVAGNGNGRWPAHLTFSHSEGCVLVGTRNVAANGAIGADTVAATTARATARRNTYSPHDTERGEWKPYGNGDGTETVEDWRCVEGCAVQLLDDQSGILKTNAGTARKHNASGIWNNGAGVDERKITASSGGASRFFYVAKPSRSERDVGGIKNTHPTVKSIALMRWLCRLITPKGGVILDPFLGSGSTGIAALAEGFSFLGIEREEEYVEIARRRIEASAGLSVRIHRGKK